MDSPSQAPPVVAVMVTCDSGPWLEDALAALGEQDYPNLSVLVVDAGSAEDPTPRVAEMLPHAFVRRLKSNVGYAAATNEALQAVEGASHFLLCHDDVAPEPDAVRLLVEEAFRSNAGLVAPKLVDWADPRLLLQVGMGVDKSGAPHPLVDRGELDQEQHDAVRDVFVAPGGCTLVRADLFQSLGGFDAQMHVYGEDLDLSWRAQVAGARVVVAPAARVRHLEAMSAGLRGPGGGPRPSSPAVVRQQVRPLLLRHRLRAVLKDYSTWHLIRVLPQVALLAVAEVVFGLLAGHTATARDTAAAWTWNLRRASEIRAARRVVRRSRRLPDSEVRRLQAHGSARFTGFVRGQLASERVRRHTTGALERRRAAERADDADDDQQVALPLAVSAGIALVLLVGSRHLLTGRIPAVHQFAPFPGAWSFLRSFVTGWNQAGLGSDDPAPLAFGLLGLGGVVLGGATGLLRTVLVLGPLPLGVIGAHRLAAPFGSRRASLAAAVVYAAIPLPYNALGGGRLGGVLAYGAAPWVLHRLLRASGTEPFAAERDEGRGVLAALLPLGVAVGVLAALAPPLVVMVLVAAAGLGIGAVLAGDTRRVFLAPVAAVGAVAVSAVLLLPTSLDFVLPGAKVSSLTGVGSPPARVPGLGALLRFETGPLGAPPVGWVFVAAAAVPLLIGRDARLAWAGRLWAVALTCWGVAWAGGRGWLHVSTPTADVLLAPAAAAVALAVAQALLTVEADLPGYRFGWRQLAPTAAFVAVALGVVPVATAAVGGRWFLPHQDFAGALSWMPERRADGAFRVLWLGDPEALPLTGWPLGQGVAYATSRNGTPDATGLWPGPSPNATARVGDLVRVARSGGTTALGHLLAPSAIRYVVLPASAAPRRADRPATLPPPPDLASAIEAQIDLRKLQADDDLLVYENAAWVPGRAKLAPELVPALEETDPAALRKVELAGSPALLPEQRSPNRFTGRLAAGDHLLLAEASSANWHLEVGGRQAARSTAFGWVNAFAAPAEGGATLRYRTGLLRYGLVLLQVGLWVAAVRQLVVSRRRSRRAVGR